jgi:hypothetical protein
MKSRWINHRGTQIFYVDFSDFQLNLAPLRAEVEAMSAIVLQQPPNSVLGLVDLRNTVLTMAVAVLITSHARQLGRHIGKAAVIVNKVTDSKRAILSSIARAGGQEVVLFDNLEEARDWLVDDK